jgi:hypothetical protein
VTLSRTIAALAIPPLAVFSLSSCSAARPVHSGISPAAPRPHRVSSCCAPARPVHHGISPAALAVVRPVFVPWKECNAAISETVHTWGVGLSSGEAITDICGAAYHVVVSIKLQGSLARNAYMKDALHSLRQLFWIKVHYAAFFDGPCRDGPGVCWERYHATYPNSYRANFIEPFATRFWYDLDHTA